MTQWILKNKAHQYDIIVCFANPGKEREETLEFVDRCDKFFGFNVIWVESVVNPEFGQGTSHKVVDFKTAARNGEPFEQMIAKYGIPNPEFKHCTRELKTNPIKSYAKSIGWEDYYTAIGIRIDEKGRSSKSAEENKILYPLIKWIPTKKEDINRFWASMPFDLNLKSYEGNCNKCFKKSLRKLMTIEKEERTECRPRDTWWEEMQNKYEYYTPESRKYSEHQPPWRFYRNGRTAQEIRDLSLSDFIPARDESKDIDNQLELFSINEFGLFEFKEPEMDSAGGCEESCEAWSEEEDRAA